MQSIEEIRDELIEELDHFDAAALAGLLLNETLTKGAFEEFWANLDEESQENLKNWIKLKEEG